MKKPIIYQILPRLWGNPILSNKTNGNIETNGTGKFKYIDKYTFDYLKTLGISHVWYTGIIRHATQESTQGCEPSNKEWVKGKAGSPYSITDYFDVNPYLAENPVNRMQEFEDLIFRTHQAGFKVIIDFIPNHVGRDYGNFSPKPFNMGRDALGHSVLGLEDKNDVHWKQENDFFYYPGEELILPHEAIMKFSDNGKQTYYEKPAKASGNSYSPKPAMTDWYDTIKINYCEFHTDTWDKMLEIIEFWANKGVDGFRCDMVELVPAPFFEWAIKKVKEKYPNLIFIAEVYQKPLYSKYIHEVGFDYLYDKSGLYDSLKSIISANLNNNGVPVEQWQSTRLITWNWQQIGTMQGAMLNFLENHDEQRFASDFFGKKPENIFAALMVSVLFNNSAFMLYFGQEVGERGMDCEGMSGTNGRTTIFDWWNPETISALYKYIHGNINALNKEQKELLNNYKKILSFAATNPAITTGNNYDLCYCNINSKGFDKDRHFAFIRHSEEETYIIICNFANQDANINLYIPQEAFKWMGLSETSNLNHDKPIIANIPKMNGIILNIKDL